MRVRPRSSLKKAWLLSAPSTVLLLSKPEMPRKLTRPKPPSGTAPGVERANVDQRRPLMGKFSMVVWFMLVVKSARSVVIIGSSAVATTTSAIALTLSCASMVVTRPTSTVMFVALNALKPVPKISSEYTPGWRWISKYLPLPSVTPLEAAAVPRFRLLTAALGTTAPDGSVTVPPIAPSVVDWALALGPARKVASSTAKNATIENPHPLLFIESLPKIFGQNTPSSAHRAKRRGHQRGLRGHPTTQAGPPPCSESDWYKLLPHEQTKSNRQNVGI